MRSAAYRRRPRRDQPIFTCGAGNKPAQLIADIDDGFFVTDMIGMGVNLVTGDYSRGASGFWIENGELTYPVSEVTIAGHLSEMFDSLEPADDLVFRYGANAPSLRVEGLTVAGPCVDGAAAAEHLAAAYVRPATGAVDVPHAAQAVEQSRLLARQRSRHRSRPLLCERLTGRLPCVAWLSEESADDLSRLTAR